MRGSSPFCRGISSVVYFVGGVWTSKGIFLARVGPRLLFPRVVSFRVARSGCPGCTACGFCGGGRYDVFESVSVFFRDVCASKSYIQVSVVRGGMGC